MSTVNKRLDRDQIPLQVLIELSIRSIWRCRTIIEDLKSQKKLKAPESQPLSVVSLKVQQSSEQLLSIINCNVRETVILQLLLAASC